MKATLGFWLTWHLLAAAAVAVIPIRFRFHGLWNLDANTRAFVTGAAITYLVLAGTLALLASLRRSLRLTELVSVAGVLIAALFLGLNFQHPVYYRSVVILSLALMVTLPRLPTLVGPRARWAALLLIALAVLLCVLPSSAHPVGEQRIIRATSYSMLARYYRREFGVQEVTGGAVSRFGDRYLLATGDGQLYTVRQDDDPAKLVVTKLPHRVPLNREEFVRSVKPAGVARGTFRTADILVHDLGNAFRLFASHHFWHTDRRCFTLRVSQAAATYDAFVNATAPEAWQTVYESTPCLPLNENVDGFGGYQSGGRLEHLEDGVLLLTVGDHHRDDNRSEMVSQQPQSAYGKTIRIDLKREKASVFTLGHRNAQGLHLDAAGRIWSTEHGPNGGDELNLIYEGRNYGWPLVTYGKDYAESVGYLKGTRQGQHDGFEEPVFAWVPSIGVSSVIAVRGKLLQSWKDDLLVASMRDASLWRVRLKGERVVVTERMEVGERIRDMVEDNTGRLVLWTEKSFFPPTTAAMVIMEPILSGKRARSVLAGRTGRGEVAFARCAGCHTVNGDVHGLGPNLSGLARRPIATAKGYRYSEVLRGMGGEWTDDKLDAFLADPQKFAPGTSMQVPGVSEADERADLIEYIKSL